MPAESPAPPPAVPRRAPRLGALLYHLAPLRRAVILANLERAFGDTLDAAARRRLAQCHYAHLCRSLGELARDAWRAPRRRALAVRVENAQACLRAHAQGRGVLLLTGHLGNWEVATTSALAHFPEYRGQFHVLRRPLPRWLDGVVTRRFRRAGFGVLAKKGELDRLLACLAQGDAVVFLMDQHAAGRDAVRVDFFGAPAGTFRSLAIIALSTGAPVVPVATWREPDGSHVLRFEEALELIRHADAGEAIRRNTRSYNAALESMILRHPEQWFWMHRRWKDD